MNIECDRETLSELENSFKFNDAVIRHLVVSTKGPVTSPSPMMKEEKSKAIVGDDSKKDKFVKEESAEEEVTED